MLRYIRTLTYSNEKVVTKCKYGSIVELFDFIIFFSSQDHPPPTPLLLTTLLTFKSLLNSYAAWVHQLNRVGIFSLIM